MSDTTSTQALVKKVQAGDQDALNSLYGRYVPRILAAVRIRLGAELRGKVESWDILQDAMFASLKNVQAFNYDGEGAYCSSIICVSRGSAHAQTGGLVAGRSRGSI